MQRKVGLTMVCRLLAAQEKASTVTAMVMHTEPYGCSACHIPPNYCIWNELDYPS